MYIVYLLEIKLLLHDVINITAMSNKFKRLCVIE